MAPRERGVVVLSFERALLVRLWMVLRLVLL
jgi:hypothetical protein